MADEETVKRTEVDPPAARVTFFAIGATVMGLVEEVETFTMPAKPFLLPRETDKVPEPPGARIMVSGVDVTPKSLKPTEK